MRLWLAMAATVLCEAAAAEPVALAKLEIDGEIIARQTAALMPPNVEGLWQLNITEIAADGSEVKQGQVVLIFDGAQTQQQLLEKQSALAEKRKQQEKLDLDLADRKRSERLALSEQRANRDKAQRKASQPETFLGRVDYQKLLAERRQAELLFALAQRRQGLAAEQRRQERRLLDSELAQLKREVEQLQTSLTALTVTAPRDGIMLHRSDWEGQKFEVGSQVWRGQAVAEIPDPSSLAVRAQVPEPDLTRVTVGDRAMVRIEASGLAVLGSVSEMGRAIRSKSSQQPQPVLDLMIEFDARPQGLKPGQPVRVELPGATRTAP